MWKAIYSSLLPIVTRKLSSLCLSMERMLRLWTVKAGRR